MPVTVPTKKVCVYAFVFRNLVHLVNHRRRKSYPDGNQQIHAKFTSRAVHFRGGGCSVIERSTMIIVTMIIVTMIIVKIIIMMIIIIIIIVLSLIEMYRIEELLFRNKLVTDNLNI